MGDHMGHLLVPGEIPQDLQRPVERQPGTQQRRELLGENADLSILLFPAVTPFGAS
jgi:hypothetical protein